MVRHGQDPCCRRVERVDASSDHWVVRGGRIASTVRLGRWDGVGYRGHDRELALVSIYQDSAGEVRAASGRSRTRKRPEL